MITRFIPPFLAGGIIGAMLLGVTGLVPAHAELPQSLYHWALDNGVFDETGTGPDLGNHQGQFRDPGVAGGCIRLENGAYMSLAAPDLFNRPRGSFSIWVCPLWSDAGAAPNTSHTFVSFSWKGEGAFGVISDGWWESHGGKPYTYFIFNNHLKLKTENRLVYTQGRWMNFTFTWDLVGPKTLTYYVNGLLKASIPTDDRFECQLEKLVIGSDQGSPSPNRRFGNCDVDEIQLFDCTLSPDQVLELYMKSAPLDRYSSASGSLAMKWEKPILALFDEGKSWMTEAGARRAIQRTVQAGFNTYIPCVWHGMGSRYTTALAPVEVSLPRGEDPLERLIRMAHGAGLQVHPWFTVALRQRDLHPKFHGRGTPDQAFDLHRPAFRRFIIELILDVARRYPVDGINLDYIRTMGFCTCRNCQDEYKARYNWSLSSDIALYQADKSAAPASLIQWNDAAVAKILREVSIQARQLRPGIIISVDGSPKPPLRSASVQGRNEVAWAEAGYVDLIFNMDYRAHPDLESLEFTRQILPRECGLVPLIGNYQAGPPITSRNAFRVSSLAAMALARPPHGFGLYLYDLLSDSQIQALEPILGGE